MPKNRGDKGARKAPQYFFIIFFIVLLIAALYIVWPYITAVIGGLILGYIFYPVYKRFNKGVKNKTISSLIFSTTLVVIFFLVFGLIINTFLKQAIDFFRNARNLGSSEAVQKLAEFLGGAGLDTYLQDFINKGAQYIVGYASNFALTIPEKVTAFFIMVFIMYYVFKDGHKTRQTIKWLLPIKKEQQENVLNNMEHITKAVVYVNIVTGIVQGIFGGIGFFIFGLPNPVLWGSIMAVAGMIPILGPMVIWLPAGLIALINGNHFAGIGILIWGTALVSLVDNFLRPKMVGDKTGIHPAVVLIGLFGGLKLFGLMGAFIGPIILGVFLAVLKGISE